MKVVLCSNRDYVISRLERMTVEVVDDASFHIGDG